MSRSPSADPHRVLITGASSGIGAASALRLARPGLSLVLHGRDAGALADVADKARARGADVSEHLLDLRDLAGVRAWAAEVAAEGRLDVVVLNAGRSSSHRVASLAERFDVVESTMGINYTGHVRLLLDLIPALDGGGHVVGITSVNARIPAPGWSAYSASKAAFDAWLRSARPELDRLGITTTTIAFPLVRTCMIRPVYGAPWWAMSPERAAGWVERAIRRRPAEIGPMWLRPAEMLTAIAPHASARFLARFSAR